MARYSGPRLKIVRRLGTPIPGLIKSDPDLRRPYPPGQHGPGRRKKLSDYALRLREKQKIRFHYGISEKQLRAYFAKASKGKGNTAVNLLRMLESRLDNVVFRMGLAASIRSSRQMTTHGHILVNNKRVDIPSYSLKIGDVVSLSPNSKFHSRAQELMADPNNLEKPSYLDVDQTSQTAKMLEKPSSEHCPLVIEPQLVVEYYSGK